MFRSGLSTLSCASILWVLAYSGAATAGAWPRGEGKSFLSFSIDQGLSSDGSPYASLFYEYGVNERLTLGIDAGRNLTSGNQFSIAFARSSFSKGPNQFAYELGVGTDKNGGETKAALRPGLSWGRGYTASWGDGWLGVESTYMFLEDGSGLGKLDSTFGVNNANGALTIIQLQYSKRSDQDSTIAIAPSYVFEARPNVYIETGIAYQFSSSTASVKLGIWSQF